MKLISDLLNAMNNPTFTLNDDQNGINYLDGFSGYGGFHKGFEDAGWKFNKVWFSEIDKYAIANYRYNYPNSIYAGSIDTICDSGIIDKLDLFTFGWPCQDNSIAGKRKGQTAGTRSGLLYSAVKVINKYKPRNFVAENVLGLLSVNEGIDIVESLRILAYLNESCPQYDVEMQLFNTRWFLPQNRERLYFVGHLRGSGSRQIFPFGERAELPACGKDEKRQRGNIEPIRNLADITKRGRNRKDFNARKLTPIEYERLQGLDENWTLFGNFNGEIKTICDGKRYELCGNGVSIPVVSKIAAHLTYCI